MIISVPKETRAGEKRVAVTPDVAKKLINSGIEVHIEKNAGLESGFSDSDYQAQGCKITSGPYHLADIIFKIWAPEKTEIEKMKKNAIVIAHMEALKHPDKIKKIKYTAFALDLIPRISRAQSMDILSSQANLAGYRAVIKAVGKLNIAVPMMITSAGTITPAKVLILGIGVAGLQAIATAKRLGAVVYASDIRPETEEQAKSLGAKFIKTEEIQDHLAKVDIIITTAMTGGIKAPILINKEAKKSIPDKTVIIDLGGNVEGIPQDEHIISELAPSAGRLFASNIYNFFNLIYDAKNKKLNINKGDEIINATLINGEDL